MRLKITILYVLLFTTNLFVYAQDLPKVVNGKIERLSMFQSKYVTARNIDIWLPDGYSPSKKYAVLYMHDGQMLYDADASWNKQAWEVDEVAALLMKEGRVRDFIVVGIWNGGHTRHVDYFPQIPFESLTKKQQDSLYLALRNNGNPVFNSLVVNSDSYLRFIVTELKPYIDSNFSTLTSPENTFIAGSSMGGLISAYAICQYPGVFGGAICMSTHWPGTFSLENNPIPDAFFQYFSTHMPNPATHKIYFDYGDQTLDAMYPPLQKRIDDMMPANGFQQGKSWITQFFPGKDHSEKAWRERLHIPLLFMMGN